MNRRSASAVFTVLLGLSAFASAQAQVADHLQCYKIKDPLKLEAIVDLVAPQLALAPDCKVGKAQFFCAPAEKTVDSAVDKATHLPITPLPVTGPNPGDRICYKVKCPDVGSAGFEATDQFGERPLTIYTKNTKLLCTPAFKGSARYVDNGDGTVTDHYTELQCEQKVSPGGGATDPHDVDNFYTWGNLAGCPFTGCPIGTAYTDFLGRLNTCTSSDGTAVTSAGFAGHCDWRLPTIQELKTIVDLTQGDCGGGSGPCIDPVFGPTIAFGYWSSTTSATFPDYAWLVYFDGGGVYDDDKTNGSYVRAVRAGL